MDSLYQNINTDLEQVMAHSNAIRVVLVSLLLTSYFTSCSSVSVVNFEHVIAGWEGFGSFLITLPKMFDYLSHRILLAKVQAVMINSFATLKLIHKHLKKRKKGTKINSQIVITGEKYFFRFPMDLYYSLLYSIFSEEIMFVMSDIGLPLIPITKHLTPHLTV